MNRKNKKHSKNLIALAVWASMALFLTSCGKNSFQVTPSTQTLAGPGSYTIPAKVDLVMVVDDTGSMFDAYRQIKDQIPLFLTNLDSKNWDYHFATIPLTSYRKVTQAVGSVYDSNRGSAWKAPYPGASSNAPGMLASSVFQLPGKYSDYVLENNMSNALLGFEPGFKNIQTIFNTGFTNTNFFRDDAMTVVFVVGNGDDTSDVNYCTRPTDNVKVPCEQITGIPACTPTSTDPTGGSKNCASQATSFTYYQNFFQDFRPNSNLRFYAAISTTNTNSCLGTKAYPNVRYSKMATALGGKVFDICQGSVQGALDDLTSSLTAQQVNYKQRYFILAQAPDVSSMTVTRLVGGDPSQAIVIPQDSSQGWTYDGYVTNVYASYTIASDGHEIEMNQVSGYAIHFHGSAEISGNDKILIDSKPAGTQNSVSK